MLKAEEQVKKLAAMAGVMLMAAAEAMAQEKARAPRRLVVSVPDRKLAVVEDGRVVTMLRPEKRTYPVEGQETADTAIRTTGLRDLYLALGDDRGQGRWTLRAYDSPLAPLIWIGAIVMALGGALSLFRRVRVTGKQPAADAAAQAAE